jgi:hypothetical protein
MYVSIQAPDDHGATLNIGALFPSPLPKETQEIKSFYAHPFIFVNSVFTILLTSAHGLKNTLYRISLKSLLVS